MDLSLRLLADAGNAQGAFKDLGTAATAAAKVIADFAKESIKAFAEAERTQRQLKLAAGQYTDALNEQAEAMKAKYAVDDDAIRHMDVLLLRYGAAPGQIEGATKAILDYSAATGKDATQAMEMLIRGVESGTGSLGKMGVHFKATGSFSADLSAAVEALGKKFGGAGEVDARSLDGRMRSVGLALDDTKKAFGAMFDEIDRRHGILDTVAAGLNSISKALADDRIQQWLGTKGHLSDEMRSMRAEADRLMASDNPQEQARGRELLEGAGQMSGEGLIAFLKSRGAIPASFKPSESSGELPMTSPADHPVGKATKSPKEKDPDFGWGPWGDPAASFEGWQTEYEEYSQKKIDELNETALKEAAAAIARFTAETEAEEKHDEEMLQAKRDIADMELDIEYNKQRALEREREKEFSKQQKDLERQKALLARAGDQMGAAIVDAFGAQLQRISEGGEMDAGEMFGDIAATVFQIAGFAIGSYLGAPQIGGAIGGLGANVIRGATRRKKHDGGVIERYHDGGWPGLGPDEVPIIGQVGEHMLSRRDVAAMGGPGGVEAAKRGGAPMVVNITAMDSQSFLDQFGRDRAGARGFFNAVRVGRGDLVPLFSKG